MEPEQAKPMQVQINTRFQWGLSLPASLDFCLYALGFYLVVAAFRMWGG